MRRDPGEPATAHAPASEAVSTRSCDVQPVIDWLIERAIHPFDVTTLVEELCPRLIAAGVPLLRINLGFRVLHPLFRAMSLTWRRGEDHVEHTHFPHPPRHPEWLRSPYARLVGDRQTSLRLSPLDADACARYPVIAALAQQGGTDYLACGVPFDPEQERGVLLSFATDRPGGFTDAHVASLERVAAPLTLACRVHLEQQVAQNLALTYLGRDAARRVLRGQIQRSDGENIHAAVLYSDLRDSTRLAETHPPAEFLALLDAYFECTAGSVLLEGGEVLALIGDAVLAIFPITPGNEQAACTAAVAAARRAQVQRDQVNATRAAAGQPIIEFGIGLHIGDVVFGNIGVPERLQFTVIGPTANEVARLESLTKTLGHRVLASDRFADAVPIAWQHLGLHELRGARTPRAVFALPAAS